ncbi:MAG: FtsL-like putative cell division protein [Dysgonamonadaceae bacterium]|jgi:hypothetical protein|nr:FtsL-like putative cell division protein [Dysgonamonadaceae bacterium]MDD3309238.1 FtsL-like putative cell division protein [Dysgonamonadaceae bacterium]MDD3899620.1 FtsL-like putative cell division protein [Dysgonamonadaceae bacterium]MDD4398133.1 FtsL-like putative cell division protein [Dysgonamonadaceae bacterium]MEA5081878.1 FtsL-like putative cell division protein [Dysgonamonadaceae bacterium]
MKFKFDNIRKSFVHVFGGSVLTEGIFVRNIGFIIALVIVTLLFISQRYSVLHNISEIERLQSELKDAKYESLEISSKLTEAGRQENIEKRIQERGIELTIPTEPVFRIISQDKKDKSKGIFSKKDKSNK